jgi:hypothetical protein
MYMEESITYLMEIAIWTSMVILMIRIENML